MRAPVISVIFAFNFFIGVASFAAAGCSKSGADAAADAAVTPVGASASASAAASASASAAGDASVGVAPTPSSYLTVPERFASESANRPTGVVRAEEASAAFKKAGFTITDEKQHLANTYQASYCVGAKAKGDAIAYSICEYRDEKKAEAGLSMNDKSFGSIKGRKTYRNGGTTLTILNAEPSPENDAQAKKLVETFMALKPTTTAGATADAGK